MDIPLKKLKHEEVPVRFLSEHLPYNPTSAFILSHIRHQQQQWMLSSSPKHIIPPFPTAQSTLPYTQEPPILQNPERVVRQSECERFERSYQPNVALAPRQTILTREREKEEGRDNCATVIKSEMQIKQERPSTPINDSSPPSIRNNSPETTSTNGGNMSTAAAAAPISPEGQSGSNEITSSTSPVPASILIPNNKQDSVSPHSSPSLTSPPPRSHLIHNKSPPVVVTLITNQPTMNGIKKKVPLGSNPDFEMSQDMDEDSLTGEPDSSNLNGIHAQQPAYELVRILLKNNSTEDHSRILDIFKYMDKELARLREIHKKELIDFQAKSMLNEEELRRKIDSLQLQLSQQRVVNGNASNIIATSCLSSSSSSSSSISSNSSYEYDRNERRNSIVEKPNVIIKPLKKSWRLTSCDDLQTNNNNNNINKTLTTTSPTANITITTSTPPTIVMMPKSEDIINNNNTKIYNNNNNNNNSNSSSPINGSTDSASLDDAIKKTTTTVTNTVVAIAPVIKSEKL
jgi:hypothetical protein